MAAMIFLSMEPTSAKFYDRVLPGSNQPITVSRSSKEEKSETKNAVFDSQGSISQITAF